MAVECMLQPPSISFTKITNSNREELALQLFQYQARKVPVYRQWLRHLDIDPAAVNSLSQIPHLPIELFTHHQVMDGPVDDQTLVFESSGTTGMIRSRHYVRQPELYRESLLTGFTSVYGPPEEWHFLALLPSYLDRPNASLVYMMQTLMDASPHHEHGFFLDDLDTLQQRILSLEKARQKTLLIGVTFALLDFAAYSPLPLRCVQIMETGGMKGRRREMIREEVHRQLKDAFGVSQIHSEYGMTELLSQAYAPANGLFAPPPWMIVSLRDPYDPFQSLPTGQTGAINIIDLANIHSCAFLATSDIGRLYPEGTFEVLGRLDDSMIRGCNLMVF